MFIKVCGLREKANIIAIDTLSIDFLGLIFYEKSPRFVEDNTENNTKNNTDIPATNASKVGVFVNSSLEYILEKTQKYQLKYIQLHGNESIDFVKEIYQKIKEKNIKIIKAISIDNEIDNVFLSAFVPFCDYFLFDTKGTNHGGNGVKFNWQILQDYQLKTPFLLSGGISVDEVAEIKNIKHAQFAGIDINSKFEIKAGLKDVKMIEKFIENLK